MNYNSIIPGTIFSEMFLKIDHMTPERFKLLSDPGKLDFLETECTLIAKRYQGYNTYELYQAGQLYIELQVYVRQCIYRQYFSFDDPLYLDPYLENIDISSICAPGW
jgi:hypothetical protein